MTDDLLTRARMLPADPVIDELIAEVKRLRPLAKLWKRLEELGRPDEEYPLIFRERDGSWSAMRRSTSILANIIAETRDPSLPEAVRALLEEAKRER